MMAITTRSSINVKPLDLDEDGVGDVIEDGSPNSGDANRDEIPDNQQPNVVSLLGSFGRQYITIESPESKRISNTELIVESPNIPGVEFPIGAFRFTLGSAVKLEKDEEVDIRLVTFAGFDSLFFQNADGESMEV